MGGGVTQTPGVARLLPRLRRLGSAVCVSPCIAYIRLQEIQSREIASRLHRTRLRQVLCSPVGPLPCLPISLTGGELRAPVRCVRPVLAPRHVPLQRRRRLTAPRAAAAAPSPRRRAAAAQPRAVLRRRRRCVAVASPSCCSCVAVAAASPSPRRRAAAASPSPHRHAAAALCRDADAAASPSPLHRRLAVVLPLRRRRLAAVLRCVAGASPSRCCGAVTLPPSCRGCTAAFPACASPVTLPTTLRRRAERSLD